jgi:Gp49-like protein DUF891
MDRKAARRRRGLEGRIAIVTRITAALRPDFTRLYCSPDHYLSLAQHLQCVGCDKKILLAFCWPIVGLIGTCWYFFGLIGSRWYVVAFGGNGYQTDHHEHKIDAGVCVMDAYRAVYLMRIAGMVHVLHAFQKKSKSGIKTPRADVELVETPLKAVLLGGYRSERE